MKLDNPNYFFNRELSWLEFNERVLEEAQDKTNVLFERLKFLAITASNLDEFFMVRVSSLHSQADSGYKKEDPSGMTAHKQLSEISKRVHKLVQDQQTCLNKHLVPALEKEKIIFKSYKKLSEIQKDFAKRYFYSTIYPILTPMAIDGSRPFPLLNNKALVFFIELTDPEEPEENLVAFMQVPTVIERFILLPCRDDSDEKEYIFIENIISEFMHELFPGNKVNRASLFRITRNSDFEIDEEDTEDLLYEIEESIKKRKWGKPVRLETENTMSPFAKEYLKNVMDLDEEEIYEINGIFDPTVWFSFTSQKGFEHLKNEKLTPVPVTEFIDKNIFDAIKEKDILVHHPYDSFDCVVDFVKTAAADPKVLAIKQTLYRVSGNSPIVSALIQAAENGKQVTVLVELKARFDEENNINWAKKLEKSGCHVVYGLVGLKIHCKACLIVRKEPDGIHRYVHLGTGNYNDSTAKTYTDLGYFTCKETFGKDVSALFNVLTGYSKTEGWNKLSVAPTGLKTMFLSAIENERKNALDGKKAEITAKMNSLVDTDIIKALYEASIAGVKIRLLVRGICCLKSGIEGISDNIKVYSIVDRFLEHSRIYYFENDGSPRIYLSSADWMPRNLNRRIEIAFPIENSDLKEKLIEILNTCLSDTVKLRIQQPNGTYERIDKRGKKPIHSQLMFYNTASENYKKILESKSNDLYQPVLKRKK